MPQERLKHHGSPNDGLPTGVRDEFPGEAEGRSAESGMGRHPVSPERCEMRDIRRIVPFTLERGNFGCCFRAGEV